MCVYKARSLQCPASKHVGQNAFGDICRLLINKIDITNTGHFEVGTSMCYKRIHTLSSPLNLQ